MKKNLLLPLIAFVISTAAGLAHGQAVFPPSEPRFVSGGPYIGAAFGAAQARRGCPVALQGGGRVCDDRDPSWGVFAGYQLNRYFGAELGYRDLGYVRGTAPTSSITIHNSAWSLVAVGLFPITERFSALGQFGAYRVLAQSNQPAVADVNATGLTYALGAQLDFGGRFGVRGFWQRYRDVKGGANFGENDYDVLGAAVLMRLR
jgi:OOP family OmpA-OmpF porin